MTVQDTNHLARELKGESNMPITYSRGKVNATVNDLTPAHQVRKAPTFTEIEFVLDSKAIFGCLPVTGLVQLGLLSIFEAHRMGFTNRV